MWEHLVSFPFSAIINNSSVVGILMLNFWTELVPRIFLELNFQSERIHIFIAFDA
jgi:hypothetical protein